VSAWTSGKDTGKEVMRHCESISLNAHESAITISLFLSITRDVAPQSLPMYLSPVRSCGLDEVLAEGPQNESEIRNLIRPEIRPTNDSHDDYTVDSYCRLDSVQYSSTVSVRRVER
jgi:hypothetical protein